jgi:hypothetical protein
MLVIHRENTQLRICFICFTDPQVSSLSPLERPIGCTHRVETLPEEGWGVFAKEPIARGASILREKPLFVIRKPHQHIREEDIWQAFAQLSPPQKEQLLLLRDNASTPLSSMDKAVAEKFFNLCSPLRTTPSRFSGLPLTVSSSSTRGSITRTSLT